LTIFGQKAWTIAHGFDRFWVIFTPFKLFLILFVEEKNMQKTPTLGKMKCPP
jgi:hypothetical protein